MANSLFCGGCGRGSMQASWKHCPHCGFRVLVPEIICLFPVVNQDELPEGWNPLFLKASDFADELISSNFAQSQLELANSEWEQDWIAEFDHDHFRKAYVVNEQGNAIFSLDLVITGQPLDFMLKEKFADLEQVQVRLVDDGWYLEVRSFADDWQSEEQYAKTLQENYGGEVFVVKPKKKKQA